MICKIIFPYHPRNPRNPGSAYVTGNVAVQGRTQSYNKDSNVKVLPGFEVPATFERLQNNQPCA